MHIDLNDEHINDTFINFKYEQIDCLLNIWLICCLLYSSSSEYAAGKASLLRCFKGRCSRYIIPCFVSHKDISEQTKTETPMYRWGQ